MATKNIVPRLFGEGGLGTAAKGWGGAFITNKTASSATEGGKLVLAADDGSVMGGNHRLGVIDFSGAEDGINTISVGARIDCIADSGWGSSDNSSSLAFYTTRVTTVNKVFSISSDSASLFQSWHTTALVGPYTVRIDSNTSGDAAQDSTGLFIDFDRTVAGSGTAAHNDIGINLDVNSASLGTSSVIGMDIDVVGATSGTSTATGLTCNVSAADTNYAALFNGGNVGIGNLVPKTVLSVVQDYDTVAFESQLADNEGGGEILRYGSAQAGAVGTLHFLHTDNTWDATDSDAAATGGSQLLGIAMSTDPGTHGMLLKGYYKVASGNIEGTPAAGAAVYVSEAAGKFDFTAPSGTGDFIRIIGYCIDIDSSDILLYFNPDSTFVEI